MHIKKQDE